MVCLLGDSTIWKASFDMVVHVGYIPYRISLFGLSDHGATV